MKNAPVLVKIALVFILINALVFFVLGVAIAANIHPGAPQDSGLKMLMMLGMFGGAIILAALYLLLSRRRRLSFFIALVVLAVIILLTIFDQVGWADVVAMMLAFVPLVLLILGRKWFLQKQA